MIGYEEFCSLPFFKKGWVCFNNNNLIWWFSTVPKYIDSTDEQEGYWFTIEGECFRIGSFDISLGDLKPWESLRKVGE